MVSLTQMVFKNMTFSLFMKVSALLNKRGQAVILGFQVQQTHGGDKKDEVLHPKKEESGQKALRLQHKEVKGCDCNLVSEQMNWMNVIQDDWRRQKTHRTEGKYDGGFPL